MTTLILVESPNKVESVTQYAAAAGVEAKVIGTKGHLLDLPAMSEGLCVDPDTWEPTSQEPKDEGAGARLEKIKAAIKAADRVLVATDGDREGEGIASEVWDLIPAAKAKRCVFTEITPAGVQKGLQELRDINRPLVEAFRTRRVLDRVFGYHATNLVFDKLRGTKTSAGRVQSPSLRLVVDRWKEVQAFKPERYFTLAAKLRHTAPDGTVREFTARVLKAQEGLSFKTEAEAKAIQLPPALPCTHAEGKEKEQKPRPPFTNSAWLQVAQKALSYPVAKASAAIQALFEDGSTTYPRTDSVRVSEEAIAFARAEIERRFGVDFLPPKPWVHKDRPGVQGAHEAIRPTDPHGHPRKHSPEHQEAFALIEARFLASQAAARRVRETVLRFDGPDGLVLEARGLVELFPGWRQVLQMDEAEEEADAKAKDGEEDATEDGALPPVAQGDQVELVELIVQPKSTKAPQLFTQASLVAELERKGIGRPSTFTAMVSLILTRGFVDEREPEASGKKKKAAVPVLIPTPTGVTLSDFLVSALPEFLDYAWTAKIEQGLDKVESGALDRKAFMDAVWSRMESALQAAAGLQAQVPDRKEFGPCPKCRAEARDGRLVLKRGKRKDTGELFEFAGCSLDTKDAKPCGYRADTQNGELRPTVPCPSCTKPLRFVERKDGGHSLVCDEHGWTLADKAWKVVPAPGCPKCKKPMQHRSKKEDAKAFFWACFEDKEFFDSDKWGKVIKSDKAKKGAKK